MFGSGRRWALVAHFCQVDLSSVLPQAGRRVVNPFRGGRLGLPPEGLSLRAEEDFEPHWLLPDE